MVKLRTYCECDHITIMTPCSAKVLLLSKSPVSHNRLASVFLQGSHTKWKSSFHLSYSLIASTLMPSHSFNSWLSIFCYHEELITRTSWNYFNIPVKFCYSVLLLLKCSGHAFFPKKSRISSSNFARMSILLFIYFLSKLKKTIWLKHKSFMLQVVVCSTLISLT